MIDRKITKNAMQAVLAVLAISMLTSPVSADSHMKRKTLGPNAKVEELRNYIAARQAAMNYEKGKVVTIKEFVGSVTNGDGDHFQDGECFALREIRRSNGAGKNPEEYRLRSVPCEGSPGSNWPRHHTYKLTRKRGSTTVYDIEPISWDGIWHFGELTVVQRENAEPDGLPVFFHIVFDVHQAPAGGSHPGHGTVR